jgi:hypothetical protein
VSKGIYIKLEMNVRGMYYKFYNIFGKKIIEFFKVFLFILCMELNENLSILIMCLILEGY